MPLRRRMAVATAVAVGIAVLLAAAIAYAAVRGELRGQVDDQLREQANLVEQRERGLHQRIFRAGRPPDLPAPPASRGGAADYVQFIAADGRALVPFGDERAIPVSARARAVAAGEDGATLEDQEIDGEHVRVLTAPAGDGLALQLARTLESVDAVLARLRWVLLALVAGGVALAAALGRLTARHLVAPVVRVTDAARHISETEDLGRRIEVTSTDEVGELAARFNGMLDTLEGSIAAQRQLIADASHELRTPVAALRTNLEVLAEPAGLDPLERERLLADVQAQVQELGALVADLIELARGDDRAPATEDVRLDALVGEAIERARRHAPAVDFHADLEPAVLEGQPDRLARAVNNLLDNAASHSRPGGVVEVHAGPDGVRVRDHGSGIDPEDLAHLFDRFYRGAGARERPGTGLGLAIVRQVAEQHGGRATAVNAPGGGGASFELRLPASAPEPDRTEPHSFILPPNSRP
jgi:two-component system, OmpR family, sensor histidine kinase MprB